jgi:subtilase family serine protease
MRFGYFMVLLASAFAVPGCGARSALPSPSLGASPAQVGEGVRIHPAFVVRHAGMHPATPSGWSPADLQAAYALPSSSKGNGQIIAVVDAYDNPDVASDLAKYRSTFGLPPANFTKYNQSGQTSNYPQGDMGWGIEIDLDVEMVSASCPNCTIALVEADSDAIDDLQTAVAQAVKLGAHVISTSWTCSTRGCLDRSYFSASGVEYLASGGDGGFGVAYPAAFDTVVATGGTELTRGGSGKRGWSETVWNGAGGGCTGEPKPKWQHDAFCKHRLANDVASVAVNLSIYDSYGAGGWSTVDGTAVSAPFLAGVFGLAGNAAAQKGARTFWQAAHHKYLYPVAGGSSCAFAMGHYNTCSGWGTPHGVRAF